jgi:hypothetical protein
MDNKGEVWKMFLVMTPSLGASLIAVSRIMDARHHPFDVITGSMLGILCASISYRQYFPSLSEPWKKGRAYPIRSWGTEPTYPTDTYNSYDSTVALRNPEEERMHAPEQEHEHDTSEERTDPIPHPQQYPPSNPYASNPYASSPYATDFHPRRQLDDGNWSSSSDEDVTNGYEMRQGYERTQNPGHGGQLPTYEPGMAYQSHTQPIPSPGPLHPEAAMATLDDLSTWIFFFIISTQTPRLTI